MNRVAKLYCDFFLNIPHSLSLLTSLLPPYPLYFPLLSLVKMFDELISDSYRVVNNKDIVPRIPRSSKTNRFLQYEHVGRTVMISEDSGPQDSTLKASPIMLWVQGKKEIVC